MKMLTTMVLVPSWPLVAAALGVGLAVGILAALLLSRIRKRCKAAPAQPMPLAVPLVGRLHAQGQRQSQQDCFSVSPEDLYPTHGLLAVVADGMGGLENGDAVSQTAVSAVMNGFYAQPEEEPRHKLLRLLTEANRAVNRMLGPENLGGSGSTLVLGLVQEERFYFLSVGDSRICLFRDGSLLQLNREHNYRCRLELNAVNGEGTLEEAQSHPKAAGLTSYLGMGQLAYVDQPEDFIAIRPGDRFLLMSDGVYNALTVLELEQYLSLPAQEAAEAIGKAVEEKAWPGQDNYTAVILQC